MSGDPVVAGTRGNSGYRVVSLADRPGLRDAHEAFGGAAWPEFMLHDPVAIAHWDTMMRYFPEYQLSLLSGDAIIAVINAVPLRFDGPARDLPDRGVDWGVEKSVADHEAGHVPDALMGMQVVVGQDHRGQGLSRAAVREMIALARAHGLGRVILPVRPSHKHLFPLIAMEEYVGWSTDAGLPYDGWLRVHVRLGGEIVRVCPRSMIIPGTIAEWSAWTGLEFPGSGRFLVPGALNPVEIDAGADTGLYTEPNVWVVHRAA